mmetsp:Transcript_18670/g.56431  ORF Transcript_18670/g.56431 Transcript_18670/m.56431 type:complete len:128 (+) Transcript_18670:115-498(+)
MGRPLVQFEARAPKDGATYVCKTCSCNVASTSAVVWEGMMAVGRPALLFRDTLNLQRSAADRREHLTSGIFTLSDVSCRGCGSVLGWRYLKSFQKEQAHKEGQTLIDRAKLAAATVHNELPQRPHIC